MKAYLGGGALSLALLLSGCGDDAVNNNAAGQPVSTAPLTQVEAPNGDWTQIVTETPDGGFMMGNPNAPVKLVEYASLSCPHCADFSEQGGEKLKNEYVKSGQVSWEFRPYLLFPTDPGVSALLRCQGAAPFFRATEQLYATQREWMAKFQEIPQAEIQRIQALPPQQQMVALTKAGGIDQFFRQRGMPEARINACLSDQQGLKKLTDITSVGTNRDKVAGTPTFFINGDVVENASTWGALEPELRKAVG